MHWWQLVPIALAALSVACLGWGVWQLYDHWAAKQEHQRHGVRTTGRVVDVELEEASFDDTQQVGYPVVHFVDQSGRPREFRNQEGYRPWPEIGAEFPLWYDPDDDQAQPVLLTAAPNLFAIVLVVVSILGLLVAASAIYLGSALR